MFDLHVSWIKCPINKTIDSGLGIKCLVSKMVILMSYVMHQTKSDIKDLSVYLWKLIGLQTGSFMIVILAYYALFYSFYCHTHELLWLIGFFVAFFYINNPAFCKTNSSEKTLDTTQKIFYADIEIVPLGSLGEISK